jgi:hypothetical protein
MEAAKPGTPIQQTKETAGNENFRRSLFLGMLVHFVNRRSAWRAYRVKL